MLGVSTRKDLNIYKVVCCSFRWLLETRPWFINILPVPYTGRLRTSILNPKPETHSCLPQLLRMMPCCPFCQTTAQEGAGSGGEPLSPGLVVWAQSSEACTSCSSKRDQICVCVWEICSETAVQCWRSVWTNTEFKTKLTDVFQVQFFGSYAFPRKQCLFILCVAQVQLLWIDEDGRCYTGRQDHILLPCQFYTVLTPLTLMQIAPNLNWHQRKESMIFLRS